MKLKDYEIPKDGMDHVLDAADLKKYNLKNFDLSQLEADPIFAGAREEVAAPVPEAVPAIAEPVPAPFVPPPVAWPPTVSPVITSAVAPAPAPIVAPPQSALERELIPDAAVAAPETPWSDGFALSPGPGLVQDDLGMFAMNLGDVPACVELPVTGLAYNPFSPPPQSSSIPRWILVTMGVFFVSAAALAITFCVVLLRPAATPAPQVAAPTVTAPAPVAQATSCADPARAEPPRAAPAEVRPAAPPVASVKSIAAALPTRVAVAHPFVRRQAHRARRTTAAVGDHGETAKSRPPQDDLDRLLGEASM